MFGEAEWSKLGGLVFVARRLAGLGLLLTMGLSACSTPGRALERRVYDVRDLVLPTAELSAPARLGIGAPTPPAGSATVPAQDAMRSVIEALMARAGRTAVAAGVPANGVDFRRAPEDGHVVVLAPAAYHEALGAVLTELRRQLGVRIVLEHRLLQVQMDELAELGWPVPRDGEGTVLDDLQVTFLLSIAKARWLWHFPLPPLTLRSGERRSFEFVRQTALTESEAGHAPEPHRAAPARAVVLREGVVLQVRPELLAGLRAVALDVGVQMAWAQRPWQAGTPPTVRAIDRDLTITIPDRGTGLIVLGDGPMPAWLGARADPADRSRLDPELDAPRTRLLLLIRPTIAGPIAEAPSAPGDAALQRTRDLPRATGPAE